MCTLGLKYVDHLTLLSDSPFPRVTAAIICTLFEASAKIYLFFVFLFDFW